jgi:hypothetical protein
MAKKLKPIEQSVKARFPNIKNMRDATEPLRIEVLDQDVRASKDSRKNHTRCVVATATCRQEGLNTVFDGVLVARSTCYIVRGNVATRYHLPQSVVREIVCYDRGGPFMPGQYQLSVPTAPREHGKRRKPTSAGGYRRVPGIRHTTTGIREAVTGLRQQYAA